MKTFFSVAVINRKHGQERSYGVRTNTKRSVFRKRQRSVLHASSTLGTTCERGSGCADVVVPVSHGAEELQGHLSLMVLSIHACRPGVGQRVGPQEF